MGSNEEPAPAAKSEKVEDKPEKPPAMGKKRGRGRPRKEEPSPAPKSEKVEDRPEKPPATEKNVVAVVPARKGPPPPRSRKRWKRNQRSPNSKSPT